MDRPLISVIVPVYKVEQFLDRCIQSIINQTYKNLEIILVDDGSPDCCPEICDFWAKKDCRIKVIHKNNGGLSSARNAGLAVCKGEFIAFLDSDDWIEQDMYEILYRACAENDVLMSVCGRYDEYEHSRESLEGRCPQAQEIISYKTMLPKMFIGENYDSAVGDKLFHRSLWDEICFPDGEIYEDLAVMYRVVINAQRIATCDVPLYHYYHRSNSITTSEFKETLFDYPKHTKMVVEDISKIFPEAKDYAVWAHIQAIRNVLRKIAKSSKDVYKQQKKNYQHYVNEMRQYRYIWKNSLLFSTKERVKCEIMSIRWLARLIFK